MSALAAWLFVVLAPYFSRRFALDGKQKRTVALHITSLTQGESALPNSINEFRTTSSFGSTPEQCSLALVV
jgi:hypothetical protein